VVVSEHPAQSAVWMAPGLPERPPPWPAQKDDCARRERRMPCSRFRTGWWSGQRPQSFLHEHSTQAAKTSVQNGTRRSWMLRTQPDTYIVSEMTYTVWSGIYHMDMYVASKYARSTSSVEIEQAGILLLITSNKLTKCRRPHISPRCFAAEQMLTQSFR